MALARWRAQLTDMSYTPVGELQNIYDRSMSMALNRTDTASFRIRTDNPFADLVQSLECYLKLYRDDTLMFFGVLQSSEEKLDSEGGSITVSAAGPGWVLPRRYPVKAADPTSLTGARSRIAQLLIAGLNEQYTVVGGVDPVLWEKNKGETGIGWEEAEVFTAGGSITYPVAPYKPMSEILAELSSAADGFDWRVLAWENWVDGLLTQPADQGTKIGKLIVGAPIGDERPEAIFEFGTGRLNVTGSTRVRTRETQANIITHLLNGQPEDSPVVASSVGSEDDTRAGLIEDIVQADLTTATLRQELVDEHLLVRMQPRDTIEWTPIADYGDGRLPRFGIDYDLGDFVTGRARSNGSTRFNGLFRVWGVEFNIDEAGVETPTLVLEYQG